MTILLQLPEQLEVFATGVQEYFGLACKISTGLEEFIIVFWGYSWL